MKNNLKAGDYIIVQHAGEDKKAKFLKYKSDGSAMHLHVNGGLRWYPINTFVKMAEKQSIAEMVAAKENKEYKIKDVPEKVKEPVKSKKKAANKASKPVKVKIEKKVPIKADKAPKKLKTENGEAKVPLPKRTADLLRAGKHTVQEIADLIGKSKAYVSNIQSFMRNPEHWKFKY